ncbi:hypothetical protein QUF80_22680 [Desulfococcaceae bacterium HSG8]|nr:hypothetical protein [Desulfococcaceae bacterium HSG8]
MNRLGVGNNKAERPFDQLSYKEQRHDPSNRRMILNMADFIGKNTRTYCREFY